MTQNIKSSSQTTMHVDLVTTYENQLPSIKVMPEIFCYYLFLFFTDNGWRRYYIVQICSILPTLMILLVRQNKTVFNNLAFFVLYGLKNVRHCKNPVRVLCAFIRIKRGISLHNKHWLQSRNLTQPTQLAYMAPHFILFRSYHFLYLYNSVELKIMQWNDKLGCVDGLTWSLTRNYL